MPVPYLFPVVLQRNMTGMECPKSRHGFELAVRD